MKKKITLFFIIIYCLSNAQIAENLYKKKYSKVGLEISMPELFTTNEPNPVNYKWESSYPLTFGLTYNYLQNKNFNMRVSALYSTFNINQPKITESENGDTYGYQITTGPYELFSIPIEAEYFMPLTEQTSFSMATGLEFTINPYGYDRGRSFSSFKQNGTYATVDVGKFSRSIPIYLGVNLGASINVALNAALLKFNAKYHYQLGDNIYTGIAKTTFEDKVSYSRHTFNGNYFSLGLTIVPNKKLFK